MQAPSLNEKRSDKRINALVTVYCEHAKRFIAAYSLDVSRRGVFIKTRDPFHKGERVDMEFVLPDCEEVLKAIGEVRWVIENGEPVAAGAGATQAQAPALIGQSGMGIEFVEISERVQNSLRTYVERLTGESWEV